ncbi:MAG: DUF58 domain-containing protein [Verrucomicrobiota bacterium]
MSTWAEPSAQIKRSDDWADPSFYGSRLKKERSFWRLIWMNILPPPLSNRTIPTPAGYTLILVSIGLGSAAYNTSSNILYMALSILLSSLILSGLMSWMNFRGTRWRLNLPSYFRAGDLADLQIEVANTKRLLPTYSLWFRVETHEQDFQHRVHLDKQLNPGDMAALDWSFRPEKRGEETLHISGLESQYPFGFLRKIVGGGVRRQILIFPERIPYQFNPPSGRRPHKLGETNRRPGAGTELINIRRYQAGDPQKQVHWKASARQQRLMVRQTAEENHDGYIIYVACSSALWQEGEQLDKLCAFAASLAEDLFRAGRLIATAINDQQMIPVKRLHDLQAFMRELAMIKPQDQVNPPTELSVPNVIHFRPGSGTEVTAHLEGNAVGSA